MTPLPKKRQLNNEEENELYSMEDLADQNYNPKLETESPLSESFSDVECGFRYGGILAKPISCKPHNLNASIN
jgi:hypothetical protein